MLSIQLSIENPHPLESAKSNSPLYFFALLVDDLRNGRGNNLKYELKHINFGVPRASIQKRGNKHLKRWLCSTRELPLNDDMIFNFPIIFFCLFY